MNNFADFNPFFMKKLLLLFLSGIVTISLYSQKNDSLVISGMYKNALTDTTSWHNLRILTSRYPGRLAGTDISLEAVKWAKTTLETMVLDSVWLQECMVRNWERGEKETGKAISAKAGTKELEVCALGGSIGTGKDGIKAKVIEISDYDDLKKLGRDAVKGKIVFINHPADPSFFSTFAAYGGVAAYRVRGANTASWYGAIAMIDRSATPAHDEFPHTGIIHYTDTVAMIPAFSISTNDADRLSKMVSQDPELQLFLKSSCVEKPVRKSYNVIGEIRGTGKPREIIAFGGHIDCWDNSQGAHDDGAGVVQTMDVLRLYKSLGIKPLHTLRVVLFMDEEMEQKGAKAYAEAVRNEKHIAAIEADRGGFTPQGFSIDATDEMIRKIQSWKPLLLPYGIYSLEKGGSGVDVRDLKYQNCPLMGLVPDAQRYFDYHHSANDTFDNVNIRELQLGTAAISAMVWLLDKE